MTALVGVASNAGVIVEARLRRSCVKDAVRDLVKECLNARVHHKGLANDISFPGDRFPGRDPNLFQYNPGRTLN